MRNLAMTRLVRFVRSPIELGKSTLTPVLFFNVGGGAQRIAEKFTDKLAAKTRGRACRK